MLGQLKKNRKKQHLDPNFPVVAGALSFFHEQTAVHAGHQAMLSKAEKDFATEVLARKNVEAELEKVKNEMTHSIHAIKEAQKREREDFLDRINSLQGQSDSALKQLELERVAHEATKLKHDNIVREHLSAIQQLKGTHDNQMELLRSVHEEVLSKLKEQFEEKSVYFETVRASNEALLNSKNQELQVLKESCTKHVAVHEEKLAELTESLTKEHTEAKASLEKSHEALKQQHEESLKRKSLLHEEVLLKEQQTFERRISHLEQELQSHKDAAYTTECKHRDTIERMKGMYAATLTELREQHNTDVALLREQRSKAKALHLEVLADKEAQHEMAARQWKEKHQSHEKLLRELKADLVRKEEILDSQRLGHDSNIAHTHERHKIEKNQLQAQKKELEMHHRKTVSDLKRQHERVLEDWQEKHGELSQEKLGLLQSHEDGKKRVKSLEEAVSILQGKISDQNVNIAELEAKLSRALENLQAERDSFSKQEEVLKTDVACWRDQCSEFEGEIDEYKQNITSLEKNVVDLKINSARDAKKAVESLKNLQSVRSDAEERIRKLHDRYEEEIAIQTQKYSEQLLKFHPAARLEDETRPEARVSLFIAMLLAGSTICHGVGQIKVSQLVTFLGRANSSLFFQSEDAESLASALVEELSPAGAKSQTVKVSQFAQYLFSKLNKHPQSLEKLRAIALGSYLSLPLTPSGTPQKEMSPASKTSRREFYENLSRSTSLHAAGVSEKRERGSVAQKLSYE